MKRWRQVHPDLQLSTQQYGAVPVVSREAMMEALADAAAVLDMTGGGLYVMTKRHPTDTPNEMVTTGLLIQWQDRTDAKAAPESADPLPGLPEFDEIRVEAGTTAPQEETLPLEDAGLQEAAAAHADDVDDGLDPSTLEEEDVSSIPESVR